MKWNRFTIKTKTEAEDMIICTLAEIGVEGAEIQDHQPLTEEDKAQMFVDIMPEGPADDGIAYLNFYLEEDADKESILRRCKKRTGRTAYFHGHRRRHDRQNPRQRTRTGSTTGKNISISSM